MGKSNQPPLAQQQQIEGDGGCATCLSRIGGGINAKCVVVLVFGLCVLLPAVFWVFPHRTVMMLSRYDASEDIKLKATVQAILKLQKPVSVLVPDINKLAYDITAEIGLPYTKVVILSMHQAGNTTNSTNVVFGILSDPIDLIINPVSLSWIRSSFISLFLQQTNLSLTLTIFGKSSSFEILKFPEGITVNLEENAFISEITWNYFIFNLDNSVCDIKQHLILLKEQMKSWLHLKPDENVFVQVTNKNGSTTENPVIIKAGVISDTGIVLPQRLKHLARRITRAPPWTNLGLNNTIFGKVKEISLSYCLKHVLHSTPLLTPAPAPSQKKINNISPIYPLLPSDYLSYCGSIVSPSPSPFPNIEATVPSPSFLGLFP